MNSRYSMLEWALAPIALSAGAAALALWLSAGARAGDGDGITANSILLCAAVWAPLCAVLIPLQRVESLHRGQAEFWKRQAQGLFAGALALALFAVALGAAKRIPWEIAPMFVGLGAAFLLLLQTLSGLGFALTGSPQACRGLAMAAGMTMLGSVFWFNPLIESAGSEAQRADWISALLHANPWVVASSYAFGCGAKTLTVLQQRHMYDLSVIGSFYGDAVPKPEWTTCALYYTFWSGAFLVATALLLVSRRPLASR